MNGLSIFGLTAVIGGLDIMAVDYLTREAPCYLFMPNINTPKNITFMWTAILTCEAAIFTYYHTWI